MIFDTFDAAYLKLCGLCRYLPADLQRRYDSPVVSRAVIANLEEHKLIKQQSNHLSFKLTWEGRNILAEMGDTFPNDARMDLKRPAYTRKLKNAEWNLPPIFYWVRKRKSYVSEGLARWCIRVWSWW